MSITTLLTLLVSSMLIYSAPLIFTSIGGVFSERGGVVNVGLEGIMVMGAFSGVVFNLEFAEQLGTATPWISLLVAGIVGAIFSLIHAVATVHFRADHVVSGTVLNLMAPALAVFLVKVLYNKGQTDNLSQTFGRFDFPVLADIPVIGDIFFKSTSLLGYIAIAFSFLAWFILFKTRFGLRLRSVGEHPQAADTLGINVYKMRYLGVVISGLLGGIGGAIYAQSISVNFSVTTIVGPGFIALAAMIFGKWNPIGAMLSSLFFGLSQSLLIHAVATVHFRADHVVSGTVLNLMAPALAVFLVKVLYNKGQTDNLSQTFGRFDFPVLADIPVIGDIFFKSTSLLGYIAIAFSFLAWFILFKTRFGLRLRSVGEHPQAADTLGINVYKMRYLGVVISGLLGGIGGAIYAQSISVNFSVTTIVGPGFIALAAMIFGKWNPIGAMLSSLFFGLSQSLAVIGSQLPFLQGVPAVYLQIAPYVLTILVLAAFFGKAVAPKADGINYIKSK